MEAHADRLNQPVRLIGISDEGQGGPGGPRCLVVAQLHGRASGEPSGDAGGQRRQRLGVAWPIGCDGASNEPTNLTQASMMPREPAIYGLRKSIA